MLENQPLMSRYTLIAVGPDGERREWPLASVIYTVGRDPADAASIPLAVPGDAHLSRQHFTLQVRPDKVEVRRCSKGRNPLFFDGEEQEQFSLRPGQVFYTGKTQFGIVIRQEAAATSHYTLAVKAKDEARLRRLQDCFEAVLELLRALRRQNQSPPWQVAFPVLRSILPEVTTTAFLQHHEDSNVHRVVDSEPKDETFEVPDGVLEEAINTGQTVTWVWEEPQLEKRDTNGTLNPKYPWTIACPVNGLEKSRYLLCVSGAGAMNKNVLEERAALVDLIGELVGHHITVQQGSEYSNLLGVFGHHVGTLFKTSGAMELWSRPDLDPDSKEVLDRLMPIWGISQAISLHKKSGEKAHKAVLETWVASPEVQEKTVVDSLCSLVSHVYFSLSEEPFLPWIVNGAPPQNLKRLITLPPLNDNPKMFDKTLALTIGLLEVLNNVRKYPGNRGSGREDRKDLSLLPAGEQFVIVSCSADDGLAVVEMAQPVVTAPDGTIARSRSLQRIRALEQTLLGALVGTEQESIIKETAVAHVVMVRHRWTYNYGQLIEDWKQHVGS